MHKTLSLEVLRECRLPIWRAFNIGLSAGTELQEEWEQPYVSDGQKEERERLEDERIEAYVLDGAAARTRKK